MTTIRLAILQRVIPPYRTALFKSLSNDNRFVAKVFIGEDVPRSKVKSANNLDGINVTKLKTKFVKVGKRIMPWHINLIKELKSFDPDVILCEGESHFLGYLQAIVFRFLYKRKVGLIHWCFISLPGEPLQKPGIEKIIKAFTRNFFDAFLLYSSYSKESLLKLGVSSEKAFVATNVGDVKKFIATADSVAYTRSEARELLIIPDRFTVLYAGTLDRNKRPDVVLEVAKVCDANKFNFILIGSGEMLEELQFRASHEGLSNVYLAGRVTDKLALYYKASDAMIIPGRGGIIMSEAMAFGIPVIVHQADGTEYDLIKHNETGIILKHGNVTDFQKAVELLQANPQMSSSFGIASRKLVESTFTTESMVAQISSASTFAASRSKSYNSGNTSDHLSTN